MVLIIRNCRILSSRRNKEARIRKLRDYQNLYQKPICGRINNCAMGSVAVLGLLFLYSVAMFTLPFVAFFGTQHFMISKFHSDTFMTNCASATVAVIVVNLIISCYAYQALNEPFDDEEQTEDKDIIETKENLNKKID